MGELITKDSKLRDGVDFAAPRPYDGPYDEGDAADDAELPLEADCSPSPPLHPVQASRNPHRRYLDGRHLNKVGYVVLVSCHNIHKLKL